MLDTPDVKLGTDPAVSRAHHRSVARVLATAPLLVAGVALALGGIGVALWGDGSARLASGMVACGLLLAVMGLATHNASRTVLAVALFRYARDDRVDERFDATTMTRALAPAPKLIHLLAASGSLVPCTGIPIAIDLHPPNRQRRL